LAPVIQPGAIEPAGAQAGIPATEIATVVSFSGSDKLAVENEAGVTYKVQYIGVRGPVRSSLRNPEASGFHGPLVMGQRVLLESEGKDADEGYRLRHAYLEGDPVPLGAKVIGAGWAVAVPYPVDHRHRAFYLQVQEQAMAQGTNLWTPGLHGPAAPWRPADSGEASYIAAEAELHQFLDLLYTVPTGQSVLNRLVRTAPAMLLTDMREGIGGFAEPFGYHVEFNRKLLPSDPRVMASVIAHEGTHAIDFATGASDLSNYACFDLEQRAFSVEAQVWAEFFGPNGKSDPKDLWERSENDVLRFAQRGDIANMVQRSAAYERQCAADR
jgi:endonuclease YncB( thermonuclease family)